MLSGVGGKTDLEQALEDEHERSQGRHAMHELPNQGSSLDPIAMPTGNVGSQ